MFVRCVAGDAELLEVLLCVSVCRFHNSFQKIGKLYSFCSELLLFELLVSRNLWLGRDNHCPEMFPLPEQPSLS